jgi:hypothetical protein
MKEIREAPGTLVYRNVTFQVETFDKLKAWQRLLEEQTGRLLTNSEVLCEVIRRAPEPS